jgi:peptidyl-prolyl cis-trans isomerase B (cyclophilin B)
VVILGLGRRGNNDAPTYARALNDKNLYVRVEAVRALSSDKSTPEMRAVLAGLLIDAKDGYVLREGLVRLLPFAKEEAVGAAFARWASEKDAPGCLGKAGLVRRDAPLATLRECTYQRHQFLADAVKAGLGAPAERGAVLEELWSSPDVRSRAAAADVAPSLLPDARAERVTREALAAPEPAVAGSAADAVGALAEKAPAWAGPLLARRAREVRATDSELFQSMLDALAAVKSPDARTVAEEALADENAAVRNKAAAVLKEIAPEAAPRSAPSPPKPPPLDVRQVLGRKQVLVVDTNRGTFRIQLDPQIAPWNVANLVTLADKGFYDGTSFHRVVPGFVVQGGDPSGTGWGGAGYNVPGEPSASRYVRGAVGIADAGKDTGGSQWFVMHQKAPHLDGRYTLVGQVSERDMAVVDALQVGDTMSKVRVER